MWEKVGRDNAPKKSEGVDVSVILRGGTRTPMLRIRIWPDVAEALGWAPDSDVSLLVGREQHAGAFRLELDRLGEHVLRRPQGEGGYLQVLAKVAGHTTPADPVPFAHHIERDGDQVTAIVLGLRPIESANNPDAFVAPPATKPPMKPVHKKLFGQNPRPPEDRVAAPPPPPPPRPEADHDEPWWAGLPSWARLAARQSHNPKVRDLLKMLAGDAGINLSKVIYAFSPPLKESIADALISETRRALTAAGFELVRSKDGIYTVELRGRHD